MVKLVPLHKFLLRIYDPTNIVGWVLTEIHLSYLMIGIAVLGKEMQSFPKYRTPFFMAH
jgi:hypothetical protein